MNIETFSRNITHQGTGNIAETIKKYFDENIAMYHIISKYNIGVNISSKADETSLVYNIVPHVECDIDKLMDTLSNAVITLYQHCYNINITRDKRKKTLSIQLRDKASS